MAGVDTRNSVTAAAIPIGRAQPAERVAAAREAQRAFFNAALAGEIQAPATAGPAVKPSTPAAIAAPPSGQLRPGSIVDIKV